MVVSFLIGFGGCQTIDSTPISSWPEDSLSSAGHNSFLNCASEWDKINAATDIILVEQFLMSDCGSKYSSNGRHRQYYGLAKSLLDDLRKKA